MSTDSPASPALADAARELASAYVHIPFCARLCPYCDFAVVTGRDDQIDRYLNALEKEIESERGWRQLDAVYIGGGTPSRVEARRLKAILERLDKCFGISVGSEISLEANPEDWDFSKAAELVEAGFNRVSFGAQSLDRHTLQALGRAHRPEQVAGAVAAARAAGFSSVNLDLIYGAPSESLATWVSTLQQALDLGLDHLSCYALTVEAGTELYRQIAAGSPAPDPDLQADEWETADALAGAAGLVRYEVSNWALPGHAVRYHLAVWAQADYLAFGLGAHRFREGTRSHNYRHLDTYLAALEEGQAPIAGAEALAGWDREIERVFLGLRRAAGVRLGEGGRVLLGSADGHRLEEAGVIRVDADRLVVAKPLMTDSASRAVLALSPP